MRLTSEHTRVAMPNSVNCPWCGIMIGDWFIEWYPKQQYEDIRDGKLPMDCPNSVCRKPVLMNKGKLKQAPKEMEAAVRPVSGALHWLQVTNAPYPDLVSFLTEPAEQNRTKFFRSGYWEGINV